MNAHEVKGATPKNDTYNVHHQIFVFFWALIEKSNNQAGVTIYIFSTPHSLIFGMLLGSVLKWVGSKPWSGILRASNALDWYMEALVFILHAFDSFWKISQNEQR
jgi:hypothetical protein